MMGLFQVSFTVVPMKLKYCGQSVDQLIGFKENFWNIYSANRSSFNFSSRHDAYRAYIDTVGNI